MASPSVTKPSARRPRPGEGGEFDWRRIAYHALVSRALDDVEEETNRGRRQVPKEHIVLYQFSARGHEVPQTILGSLLTHPHDPYEVPREYWDHNDGDLPERPEPADDAPTRRLRTMVGACQTAGFCGGMRSCSPNSGTG